MANRRGNDPRRATYVISIAAELAGVHPQTLRVYERRGLLRPQRTEGNTRRYSDQDIAVLRRIQALTQEGINLAGVMRIMQLEVELERMEARFERALAEMEEMQTQVQELLGARKHDSIVRMRDVRRIRRAMKADFTDRVAEPSAWPAPPVGGLDNK